MSAKPKCETCQIEMEQGFTADFTYGFIRIPTWCRGSPKKSFMFGEVQAEQSKSGHKIITYRCPKCFALRMYAPPVTT